MATMQDVARRAGVSVSTVSYVLTGARPISQATRAKVLSAMAELDYQPNAMARGLASRRSRILGLLMPMDERGLGATETAFVTGAAAAASAAGYHLVLSPIGAGEVDELRRLASQRMLDGALLMEVQLDDPRVDVLRELSVPLVLIGRTADTTGLSYVDIDFDRTVRDAVDHLVRLGHRRIVYVNHSPATIAHGYGPALRTRDAFVAAMSGHGLDPLMIAAEDSAAGGRDALSEAFDRAPDLSAVLAMNESAVFGILGELARRGLAVPGDVSVVSMVTSPQVAELATPALTAMTSPGSALGRIAVETLLRHIDADSGEIYQQLLPCVLEVRGSSGPPGTAGGAAGDGPARPTPGRT
ncbi:LacI family transcriptional regulator [Micromonospora sp. PPF5-17]|uniref:LacI family transcriptional regulator n=2 Tax=Micromonosporaceae TaxID=28056 RepID=A0ABX9WA10_9ACTN|nr:LacI family transcriptional regulator [Micromonospora sp. PPF5-17B]NES39134.1 LacI family transcriptional regulator [Micromonospora solifontis]NES58579.1 LacI family transcriptional regulator [Micromonospora sp. PPF5-6]RNL90814.1 LacI family transcriptional regulator [Micromonospora solifontis]